MSEGNQKLLGRVAVAAKLITMDQLDEALREQGRGGDPRTLGDILVEKGLLTPRSLQTVVDLQKRVLARARARPAVSAPPVRESAVADPRPGPATAPPRPPPASGAPGLSSSARPPAPAPGPGEIGSSPDPGLLDELLRSAVESGASDLHVHSGAPLRFRVRGRFFDHGSPVLEAAEARRLVLSSMGPAERRLLEERGEIDFCYALDGVGRFRANVYRQLRGIDGVFRVIPSRPPTLEALGLPSTLARFTTFHQGMVLITGPAGCGKSATLAALVNLINEERQEHILTIEDPIEVIHPSKRCLVNQRAVHRHTETFARALRAALREDPDVIVIGELRDRETIGLALSAAETGHFVLATLHTDSAIRTVRRLVGAFPPNQQEQVRTMLSESLRAVLSQRLLVAADDARLIPALEILVVNRAVGNLIRENKTVQLQTVLQTGGARGMCLLDVSLAELVRSGAVAREEALRHAGDPKRIPK